MRLLIDLQAAQGVSRTRGIGRYTRELALAMARDPRGHEVIVALNSAMPCADLVASFRCILPQSQIMLWRGPRNVPGDGQANGARAAGQMLRARAFVAMRPDVIHVGSVIEGFRDDVISNWPPDLARLPTVATCYDLIPLIRRTDYLDGQWRGLRAQWYFAQVREMSMADGLLAISESSRREAIDHIGFDRDHIVDIRAGVAPAFRPPPPDAAAAAAQSLLARYGLRPPFVLFVGAGDPRKNEAALLQAFAQLPLALRDRHQLAIVGYTDVDALNATTRHLGLAPDSLALVPFVDEGDLPALYAACALFVMPSLHEGFGLPAAEAMACGAPTIASNTTSLPEVVGREDALFDPSDPGSIADRMRAVLDDPALQADLRAHGLRQAAQFTWHNSAAEAWTAIERVHTRLGPPPAGTPRRLPRLAMVSPLPSQESGIATYAARIAAPLSRHYDITLVCDRGTSDDDGIVGLPVLSPDTFLRAVDQFDRILYHVGNSAFHQVQLERLLPAAPGVVVLHDAFLSNMLDWRSRLPGATVPFMLELLRAHGWAAAAFAEREGREAALRRYPCSLGVVRRALGLIQHSAHGHAILAEHFGAATVAHGHITPLMRSPVPGSDRAAARRTLGVDPDTFVIASFGGAAGTKMPDIIIAAWRALHESADWHNARLVFVGDAIAETERLFDDVPNVVATGWVDIPTYRQWLAAADVAVQLRRNSRGESSAAVIDCLSAGLPTVVNAHGSAAELPSDAVLMLPDAVDALALASALQALRDQPERRTLLAANARAYAHVALAPGPIVASYADAIEAAYAGGPAAARLAVINAVRDRGELSQSVMAAIAVAAAATFPSARPAQLLVFGAPPALADWLAHHPLDIRVHPVRITDRVLHQDWDLAQRLLAIRALPGPPDAAETGPGDVLLVAADTQGNEAALHVARERGVAVLAMADIAPALKGLSPHATITRIMSMADSTAG